MGSTAARVEVAISSTEYDLAIARDLAERLTSRLSGTSKSAIQIGATADASTSKSKDEGALWTKARVVVVLHDRLWNKTPATEIAATAISARKTKSAKSLRIVRLDDSPLRSSLRGIDAKPISLGLDALVDWIAAAVAANGGSLRKKAKVASADAESRRAEVAATFLGSSRAVAICAREFERLADGIAKRAATLGEKAGTKAEVQRMPDRCIVQLGPVALSVSWVRERVDTAATGRLMIAEWNGTIVRSPLPTAPAVTQTIAPRPATLVRENILRADATGEPDWIWRREPAADVAYPSRDLAAKCVDSLLLSLQEAAS
jgi:hypothetical protein